MNKLPVIAIAGPTGAGKSAAALLLADKLNGVIVNSDSRQVYRDFPIITAQPTQMDLSRYPHALYGFLSTEEKLSAGEYVRMATEVIQENHSRGKISILTGGTGFYLKALLDGIANIPDIPKTIHARVVEWCEQVGSPVLYEKLREIDPEFAAKRHPNDKQRITRALEVYEATGKTLSYWHKLQKSAQEASPFAVLKLGVILPLKELEPRLWQRIGLMCKQGALEEAREAFKICPDSKAPGWSGIGCAELYSYLQYWDKLPEFPASEIPRYSPEQIIEGKDIQKDLIACLSLWQQNTRSYAKRQITWFKADSEIIWHSPGEEQLMLEKTQNWLDSLA